VFWDFEFWFNVWHTPCVILEWWLKHMCNGTKMPHLNFKRIHLFSMIVSVSSFSAFLWSENPISGHRSIWLTKQYKLQFRFLGVTYGDVMCELCCVDHFAKVIWSMVLRTHVPNQKVDGIVRYVYLCWVFQ